MFLVAAVVVAAALIAGVIQRGLSSYSDASGARPGLSGGPEPSPSPLPRPGPAPRGALDAGL